MWKHSGEPSQPCAQAYGCLFNLLLFFQFRVFYINRNLSQEVAALYKMATELTCLFDAFVGGCTWLEEFRGRLLVVACAMVKACHGQVSMWRELHLFLEPLLALSWLQFPIKTVRELDSINAFIQVCQEVRALALLRSAFFFNVQSNHFKIPWPGFLNIILLCRLF